LPNPEDLIGYALDHTSLGYRTRYNLACYYSERSRLALAMTSLRIALDESSGTGLDGWAAEDPSLEALRNDPTYGAQFFELVWETSDPSPLSKLDAIGPAMGAKLAAASVLSTKKLIQKVGDGDERARLLSRLWPTGSPPEGPEAILTKWSEIAELMQCTRATPDEINLLGHIGIRSSRDLLTRPVGWLVSRVTEAASAITPKEPAPAEARVRGWWLLAHEAHPELPGERP
jgi:hypothetical protein